MAVDSPPLTGVHTCTSPPLTPSNKQKQAMGVFPATAIVTPSHAPLDPRSRSLGSSSNIEIGSLRKRLDEGLMESPAEEEKRQDSDSLHRHNDLDSRRISPRSSPIAVLKLRRTNLFPEDEGKPTNPITVTYSPSSFTFDGRDERSLASSLFLVSPLRPLARQRVSAPSSDHFNARRMKASLIDSSESVLRPLTPLNKHNNKKNRHHRPKRSLSDVMIIDDVDDNEEECKEDDFQLHQPSFTRTSKLPTQQQSSTDKETKQRWLIPAEHPYKILWDVLTFCLSFANVYATHMSIRDRQFGNSWFMTFCETWFMLDILLNFFTEYRSDSYALRDCRSVWARYLTTWFVVDVLSLFPGEVLYLQPLIDQHKRRNFFTKNFFRTKAVVRVSRKMRLPHFKLFGQVAKHSKLHAGVGASRLLRLLIYYTPKYLQFFRNMRGILIVRMLRQVHWFRKVWRNAKGKETSTNKLLPGGQPDTPMSLRKLRPSYDEDDDGAPF